MAESELSRVMEASWKLSCLSTVIKEGNTEKFSTLPAVFRRAWKVRAGDGRSVMSENWSIATLVGSIGMVRSGG